MVTDQQEDIIIEFSQLSTWTLPDPVRDYGPQIEQLVAWFYDYLCQPHPDLGRPGPVCPFVPTAIEKGLIHLCFYPQVELDTDPDELRNILIFERDRFLELEPRSGNNAQFKANILLFPNLPEPDAYSVIETIQRTLQEEFVSQGLMVGEFHSGPPMKPGLWNRDFLPLHCPIPLIAIRHMVPTDILFLKDQSTLVTQYLRLFGDLVPARFQPLIEEAAEKFGFDLPSKHPAKSSAPTVIYHLTEHKVPYQIHRHSSYPQAITRPEDFAHVLGYDVARISKSLFVRDPKHEVFAILVIGATYRADLAKLASQLGVNRLELADEQELRLKVGHPRMAVTPIGIESIPVFIDEELMGFPTILTGAGVAKMEIEMSPKDLCRLSGARVLPFRLMGEP